MLGVARGTDYDRQLSSAKVLTLYKSPGAFIPGDLPKPVGAKPLYRTADKGVLVDLSGPVSEYSAMTYTPEALDITRAHALLDKLQAEAAGKGQFSPETRPVFKDETERLLREAQYERDLARVAEHETLMLNEGLSPDEIKQLTDDERARLARKYATPRITSLTKALEKAHPQYRNATVDYGADVEGEAGGGGGGRGGGGGGRGGGGGGRRASPGRKMVTFPSGDTEDRADGRTREGKAQQRAYFDAWAKYYKAKTGEGEA